MSRTRLIGRTVAWIMVAVFVVSILVWLVTRERLPSVTRIATANPGGLYHAFGLALQPHLEERTGRRVVLVETEGSRDDRTQLLEGHVELAIIQSGAVPMDGLFALIAAIESSAAT